MHRNGFTAKNNKKTNKSESKNISSFIILRNDSGKLH